MANVAIYCRLSKEDEREGESGSIQNQREMLIKYASDRAWHIVGVFADDDWSGADSGRPAWNEMLDLCENKKVDIVLCKNQSRFSRDNEQISKYLYRLFPIWGVRFVGVTDNIDSERAETRKMGQINGLVNEWYLEDISNNIRSVFKTKMQNGEYIGALPPFGYKRSPNDRHKLIIDPDKAKIVKQMFAWRIDGLGCSSIARKLNIAGIPTPSGKIGKWYQGNVAVILNNQMYCGDTVQGKRKKASYKSKKLLHCDRADWIIVENTHEALIDRDVFFKLQKQYAKYANPNKKGTVYNYAGKVFCCDCGKPMHRYTRANSKEYIRCDHKFSQVKKCKTGSVAVELLDYFIINELRKNLANFSVADYIAKNKNELEELRERLTQIDEQLKKLAKATADSFIAKSSGALDDEMWKSINKELARQKQELETECKEITEKINKLNDWEENGNSRQNNIEKFLLDGKITKGLIADLVGKIIVGEKQKDGTVNIEIIWNC